MEIQRAKKKKKNKQSLEEGEISPEEKNELVETLKEKWKVEETKKRGKKGRVDERNARLHLSHPSWKAVEKYSWKFYKAAKCTRISDTLE